MIVPMWRQSPNPTFRLVQQVIERLKDNPPKKILDMGGRDGWIGKQLLDAFPEAHVTVVDIDPSEFGRHEEMTYIESDMFDKVNGKFDLLVSDTNYMTQQEWEDAGRPEPKVAYTDGGDGTSMAKTIAAEASKYLHPGSLVALEIGGVELFSFWYSG